MIVIVCPWKQGRCTFHALGVVAVDWSEPAAGGGSWRAGQAQPGLWIPSPWLHRESGCLLLGTESLGEEQSFILLPVCSSRNRQLVLKLSRCLVPLEGTVTIINLRLSILCVSQSRVSWWAVVVRDLVAPAGASVVLWGFDGSDVML